MKSVQQVVSMLETSMLFFGITSERKCKTVDLVGIKPDQHTVVVRCMSMVFAKSFRTEKRLAV